MLVYILLALSVALPLLSGSSIPQIGGYFVEGLTAWSTLQLIGIVTVIEMITVLLESTGGLRRLLIALRRIFDDARVLIAVVPSLFGALPVPGGALLSAPMVGNYGDEIGFNAESKSSVNLFFRHVFDLVFPFRPHLILVAAVVDIPIFTLAGWQIPVTLATAALGFWYLVGRRSSSLPPRKGAIEEVAGRSLWVEMGPLIIPLPLALGLGVDFLWAALVGLMFGLLTQKVSWALLKKMLLKGIQPRLLFLLVSVMIFKTVLGHSILLKEVAGQLTAYGVPVALLVILLPLVVSVATGMELASVGITFPLLIGLIPAGTPLLPYIVVMMAANATGQVLSPVHTCMVLGNQYFGANLGVVVRDNLPPMAFRLAGSALLAWALATYWIV